MKQKFNLIEKETRFEFEFDDKGFIWLLNNEFEGSKINLGQEYGNIKNIENAKKNAKEMLYAMNII